MDRHFGVRWCIRRKAQFLGEGDQLLKHFVRPALGLDLSVYDLDEDAREDGAVEHLLEAVIGFVVGLAGLGEQRQGVLKGIHSVIDLSDGLATPAVDLGLLLGDALLFLLKDVDGDGVAVVELDELLLLGGQLTQAALVAFGFLPGVFGLAADELTYCVTDGLLFLWRQPRA